VGEGRDVPAAREAAARDALKTDMVETVRRHAAIPSPDMNGDPYGMLQQYCLYAGLSKPTHADNGRERVDDGPFGEVDGLWVVTVTAGDLTKTGKSCHTFHAVECFCVP
jgi:hypothetical protein